MNSTCRVFLVVLLVSFNAMANVKMAVTVDDLPNHGKLPNGISRVEVAKSILATLKKFNVPEVYGFINAHKIDEEIGSIEVLNLWVNAGYPLGNHTFSHPNLNKTPTNDFIKEIDLNENLLAKLGSKFDWHYFRYPYLHEGDSLEKRNAVRSHLQEKGYKIAQITFDFEDWAWNEPYARCKDMGDTKSIIALRKSYMDFASEDFERVGKVMDAIFHRPVAHILLLHIGAFDAETLPALLQMYKDKGVEFIPLSEAVKDSVYKEDTGLSGSTDDFPYQLLRARHLTSKDIGLPPGSKFPGKELSETCATEKL